MMALAKMMLSVSVINIQFLQPYTPGRGLAGLYFLAGWLFSHIPTIAKKYYYVTTYDIADP